jgi:hypothetical protein
VSESESDSVAAFAFVRCLAGTPVGRTSFAFPSPGEIDVGVSAPIARKANPMRMNHGQNQRFIERRISDKESTLQAAAYKSLPR